MSGPRVDYHDPALAYEGFVVVPSVGVRTTPWNRHYPIWRQPADLNRWCRYCTQARWAVLVLPQEPRWGVRPVRHHHYRFELQVDAALWSLMAGAVAWPRAATSDAVERPGW